MNFLPYLRRTLRQKRLTGRDPVDIFSAYARNNKWGDKDSLSGKGSNLEATADLRKLLPALLRDLGATSMVDVPCGDFYWMSRVDLVGIDYLGGDIVASLIEANRRNHARPDARFEVIDLISGPVPMADVIFVRDCLVHLSNADVLAALGNIARSGGIWLLTTTFPNSKTNRDIATGQWRPINLANAPFNLPPPALLIAEGQAHLKCQGTDKMLGLWRIDELPG